jgi:AcrR family transcriptional regulator
VPRPVPLAAARAELPAKAAGDFARDGWGVTTRELADRHGVSPATINNAFAVEQWEAVVGAALVATAGQPADRRLAAVFDAVAVGDPVPHQVLARAVFDLRFRVAAKRDQEHPGRSRALAHRERVTDVVADIVVARGGRDPVVDRIAALLNDAGYAVACGRPDDVAAHRDGALALLELRLRG